MPSVPSRQEKQHDMGVLDGGDATVRGAVKMHNGVLPATIHARPWSTSIGGGHGLRIQARRRKMATGSWRRRPGVRLLMERVQ
jgi:hypothetical protein